MKDLPLEKRDEIIRFRVDEDFKKRLLKIAKQKKKKPSEYLREVVWNAIESGAKESKK